MLEQLQLRNSVAAVRQVMSDAWSTASDYDAHLTGGGDPDPHERRLLQQAEDLFIRVSFMLEALQLRSLLTEFQTGFQRFRHATRVDLEIDDFGNPFPLVLDYLHTFVSLLASAVLPPSESLEALPLLERILEGTPKLLHDRKLTPNSEADVRREIFTYLLHIFPDTVRDVPIAQVSKIYKPDIGIRRLKAGVEYKFVDSLQDARRVIGGIYEDIHGYEGSSDWTTFYAVIYMTEPFLTRHQVEAEWQLTKVPHSWKLLLVTGRGRRSARATARKNKNTHTARASEPP